VPVPTVPATRHGFRPAGRPASAARVRFSAGTRVRGFVRRRIVRECATRVRLAAQRVTAPRIVQPRAEDLLELDVADQEVLLEGRRFRQQLALRAEDTLLPSNTSSSWPPTMFT
jgi:hypothetical protein